MKFGVIKSFNKQNNEFLYVTNTLWEVEPLSSSSEKDPEVEPLSSSSEEDPDIEPLSSSSVFFFFFGGIFNADR